MTISWDTILKEGRDAAEAKIDEAFSVEVSKIAAICAGAIAKASHDTVRGAVITEMLALWLSGHVIRDETHTTVDRDATDRLRMDILNMVLSHIADATMMFERVMLREITKHSGENVLSDDAIAKTRDVYTNKDAT